MEATNEWLGKLQEQCQKTFQTQNVILSFDQFLEKIKNNPHKHIRSSASYLYDVFEYFGRDDTHVPPKWKLFEVGTHKGVKIIGNEIIQNQIADHLKSFMQQGYNDRLIMIHGPNGSAKSSILDAISNAMNIYSKTDEGAVYRLNWVFPTEKSSVGSAMGTSGPIGFLGDSEKNEIVDSFAFLDESKVAAKIHSEYKENPIFLLPMPYRETFLKEAISQKTGKPLDEVQIPGHMKLAGLSKRNQSIFEALLNAYDGNIRKVLSHVQIERFYFSKQYRVGIGTVEPQLAVDAQEQQLTMDKSISNLPPILHNISFFESRGSLIEANRGIVEFSDMLKRPLESFKYLLSTVEKNTINLASSTANLDIVFFATTNEKHLDAFKQTPDFASFKARFELVTAPYLLDYHDEVKIYKSDLEALKKAKPVGPYTLEVICLWAVLTRLRRPNTHFYTNKEQDLIKKLDPINKARLYSDDKIDAKYSIKEAKDLASIKSKVLSEYASTVAFEGRFGVSPREIKSILYKSILNPNEKSLTPISMFKALEDLIKEKSVYQFLQIEPQEGYHKCDDFIEKTRIYYAKKFQSEFIKSMSLVDDVAYESLIERYIDHVVASVKKEKIYDSLKRQYVEPSENIMKDIEDILKPTLAVDKFRESLITKLAARKIENPNEEIVVVEVFDDILQKIESHYYKKKEDKVKKTLEAILALDTESEKLFTVADLTLAKSTLENLEARFGYDKESSLESAKFLINRIK